MNIYIACGLTHVPRYMFSSYVKRIHYFALELERNGHNVKYALKNSDPQLANIPENKKSKFCYKWDKEMVNSTDLIIAEATFPSIGLGIEMQIANTNNIPIILCYRELKINKAKPIQYTNPDYITHDLQIGEGYISLMALGLPNIFQVIKYLTNKDCIVKIRDVISLI